MNREYVLLAHQREYLNTFIDSTKYSTKALGEVLWGIPRNVKTLDIYIGMWLDSCDYEDCDFEIIPDGDNYKLIIYTNE